MGNIKKLGKGILASSTVGALVFGGSVAAHFMGPRGEAGVSGAVVDLNEQNGMLLRDLHGRPAFVNYFDSAKPGEMELDISIATTQAMPHALSDPLGQITKYRQEHVSRAVAAEDYRPIDAGSAEVIRDFFREFEALTGIRVNVRENDDKADITIGGYISHDNYIGFASFPQEVPIMRHLPQNRGFMMLDVEYLKKKLQEGNVEAVLALISHEFGHNLGLLHPHDGLVHTGMSEKQQDAVARMAYNNHTFPAISTTDIDTGYGPLDIHHIRESLRELGVEPPAINAGDDTYLLSELAEQQRAAARAKGGYLTALPALSLLDNGGRNTLTGTAGDDLLVTESGYCGLLQRDEQRIRLMKDGQPYCLVEGEFSVVRSGAGDDLILTANGTEQTVYLGTGKSEVALVHEALGEKTLVSEHPQDDEVTLTLHQSLLHTSDVQARQDGDSIVLEFFAPSGRDLGRVTLENQAQGQGIDRFRVVDDYGQTVAHYDVSALQDAARWQDEVVTPALDTVGTKMRDALRAELAQTRQALAGSAGEWTAAGVATRESAGNAEHGGGCGCAACLAAASAKSNEERRPEVKHYPKEKDTQDDSHVEAVLRRRRKQQEQDYGQPSL